MRYLNENNLNELIKEGSHLVDFYADWCGPCKMLMPVLESLSKDVDIIKVDIDAFSDLAREYGIMSVPTLLYIKDGKIVNKTIGFMGKEEIKENLKEIL